MKKYLIGLFLVLASVTSANAAKAQIFTADDYPQHWCLAQNIYYESRGSNLADMAAVSDVVLNRVKDTRYPNTICGVVQQGKKNADGRMKRNACQFSWYCDGKSDWPKQGDAWFKAQMIAYQIIEDGKFRGITEGATHYHADYVKPRWASSLQLIGRIGEHIFYRWEN